MNGAASPIEGEPFSFELPPPEQILSFELAQLDRREKPRQVMRVQARISPEGDEPLDAHTVDLSAHGLAITSARPLNVERECNVELGISVRSCTAIAACPFVTALTCPTVISHWHEVTTVSIEPWS
jgi:hypothetical protein